MGRAQTCPYLHFFLLLQGEKGDRGERVSGSVFPWLLCPPGQRSCGCLRALQLGRSETSQAVTQELTRVSAGSPRTCGWHSTSRGAWPPGESGT